VGEAVANEAELALLGVLLDGVEGLLLGDLRGGQQAISMAGQWPGRGMGAAQSCRADRRQPAAAGGGQWRGTHLHLRVGPAGDLDDHVEDGLLLVGIQRNVVPCRDGLAVLLDEDAVLKRVGRCDLAGGVSHGV
jgi:hypothetical protein